MAIVLVALLFAAMLLTCAPKAQAAGAVEAVEAAQPTVAQADPTPTPTLGVTETPTVNPPGDADTDAQDTGGIPWLLVILIGVPVMIVLSFLLFRGRPGKPDKELP